MLNTYLKHVTYNLFLGCSFTDMTRRFVDYMCVVFCCKLVRCSYLYVVLFSIWGLVWAPRRMPTHLHPSWSEKRSQSHRVDHTRRRSVGSFLICLSRGFFIAVLVTYWRDHSSFLALRQLCHLHDMPWCTHLRSRGVGVALFLRLGCEPNSQCCVPRHAIDTFFFWGSEPWAWGNVLLLVRGASLSNLAHELFGLASRCYVCAFAYAQICL